MSNLKNAARMFKGFNNTATEQLYEVNPQPAVKFHAGNWQAHWQDMTTDFPDVLDPTWRHGPGLAVRFEAPVRRIEDNFVEESFGFDSNGKIRMSRKVQFGTGTNNAFDLDDFVLSCMTFCLHGLNIFLGVRPLAGELQYVLSASGLKGKAVSGLQFLEDPTRIEFVCPTTDKVMQPFSVPLKADPIRAVDTLLDELLGANQKIVAALSTQTALDSHNSAPRKISAERFTQGYEETIPRLHLTAVAALRERRRTNNGVA